MSVNFDTDEGLSQPPKLRPASVLTEEREAAEARAARLALTAVVQKIEDAHQRNQNEIEVIISLSAVTLNELRENGYRVDYRGSDIYHISWN